MLEIKMKIKMKTTTTMMMMAKIMMMLFNACRLSFAGIWYNSERDHRDWVRVAGR